MILQRLFWNAVGRPFMSSTSVVSFRRPQLMLPPVARLPTGDSCTWPSRRFRSNRSRRGLYDGKDVRTGNRVSFSMKTTKRKFKPNVFIKRVYSETLDEMVRFHLTASALRSIDKAGGLDNYLLRSKHVKEGEGLAAKKRIMKEIRRQDREADQGPLAAAGDLEAY